MCKSLSSLLAAGWLVGYVCVCVVCTTRFLLSSVAEVLKCARSMGGISWTCVRSLPPYILLYAHVSASIVGAAVVIVVGDERIVVGGVLRSWRGWRCRLLVSGVVVMMV